MIIKLQITIILLSLISIIVTNGYYINFIPYNNNQCKGENVGLGFSVIGKRDTCLTLDGFYGWVFNYNDKNATVSITQHRSTSYTPRCGEDNIWWRGQYTNMDCINGGGLYGIDGIDSGIQLAYNTTIYYRVQITVGKPIVSSNSYVQTYALNGCSSNPNSGSNMLAVLYLTNGTVAKQHESACAGTFFEYLCVNGQPKTKSLGNCHSSEINGDQCVNFRPFTNSSSEDSSQEQISSSCTSGTCSLTAFSTSSCISGSCDTTSSCTSGSCDATSTPSTTSCESGSCSITATSSCTSGSCDATTSSSGGFVMELQQGGVGYSIDSQKSKDNLFAGAYDSSNGGSGSSSSNSEYPEIYIDTFCSSL